MAWSLAISLQNSPSSTFLARLGESSLRLFLGDWDALWDANETWLILESSFRLCTREKENVS